MQDSQDTCSVDACTSTEQKDLEGIAVRWRERGRD